MKVLSDKEYKTLWKEIDRRFNYPKKEELFDVKFPCKWKTFRVHSVIPWNQEQEYLVNDFFKSLSDNDLYAVDWQHDCFTYNPNENIPLDTFWEDKKRGCNVYFPSYYPNGDYYAFTSMNFEYGLWGHPWKHEIYVVGETLIRLFEKNKDELSIVFV